MITRLIKRVIILVCLIFFLVGCNLAERHSDENLRGELIVFHAGSFSLPIKALADSFRKTNPDVTFKLEAAGSIESIRKITELGRSCDVLISADYKVIDNLLIPQFASWNIPFAGNEMVIVYQDKSRLADKININNWFDILVNKDVAFGRSDPYSDPCGYRTVITLKLAEKYYKRIDIAEIILRKDNSFIRPKEVDLLALLETNTVDYIFSYKSVALQHGLRYLELPTEINLSETGMDSIYKSVSVEVKGETPQSAITVYGEPVVYGVTIPRNTPNTKLALEFVRFLLSESGGQAIISEMGQTPVVPSVTLTYDSIPELLKEFALKK